MRIVALLFVFTLVTTACSDDTGAARAEVRAALVEFGLTEEQAGCVAEEVSVEDFDEMAAGDLDDRVADRFEECGYPLVVAGTVVADIGDLSPMAQELAESLMDEGLTEPEAVCLAAQMTGNLALAGDLASAVEVCEIDIARLVPEDE